MNNSTSTGGKLRGAFAGGCSLILLCGGLALLVLAALRLVQPAGKETVMLSATPAATVNVDTSTTDDRPPDGKLLQTPKAEFPSVPVAIDQQSIPDRASLDYDRLFMTITPVHDYFAAAEELGRFDLGERTTTSNDYQLGDRATFNTADGPRQAELVYQDDLALYWVEIGLEIDRVALAAAADRLRSRYYPLLSRHIGQEWRPGMDGDPRFTVLHVLGAPDTHELGYFTDEDQYPLALFSESNEREMVYLNMAQVQPGAPLYDGTLIHEVQHLIQWNLDANEDKWFNEGLSQIAETMAGLDTVDPRPYLEATRIRLDRWVDAAPEVYAHYAGSYLYLLYFREQVGDTALTELARHPANGLAAVRAVLAGHRPDLSLERFSADWATAVYLDGESADPRLSFQGVDLAPPFFANRVRQLPFEAITAIDPYAVDYIDLDFSGPATLTFAGDTVAALTDPTPAAESFWYAPRANSGRSQLTAAVDLSGLDGADLSFAAWYDLESGYDFTYLSASADGGETWQVLEPEHATLGAYGPAWGGRGADAAGHSAGWIHETIDLDAYAGRPILLRFDVVTDFEEFGRGFAVSDLEIPQLAAQPEWQPNGFVETGYLLPQRWEVRLIREGEAPEVIPIALDALNRARVTVELGPEGGVLIIMPLTPFVESAADYWLSVTK